MGAYLSKPVTEKISSEDSNGTLVCGASSMQGWRVYQEDAHNVILDFNKNQSLFAVYDGHGGSEVAIHTANELPNFIKKVDAYNKNQLSQALIDSFLEFDATLIEPEVLAVLNTIAGTRDQEGTDSDYDGEEVDHLCREATMPLEEVMAKYSDDVNLPLQTDKKVGCCSKSEEGSTTQTEDSNESKVEAKLENEESIKKSHCDKEGSESNLLSESSEEKCKSSSPSPTHNSSHIEESTSSLCNGALSTKQEDEATSANNNSLPNAVNGECEPHHVNGRVKDEGGGEEGKIGEKSIGEKEQSDAQNEPKDKEEKVKKESKGLNTVSNSYMMLSELAKGKGKAKGKGLLNTALAQAMRIVQRNEKRKAAEKAEQISKQIQVENEDDQSEDDEEEDDNFEENCAQNCEENSSTEEEEDSEDEEEEEEDDDESNQYHEFSMNMREEPGYDSGCTACVALLDGFELYVANVGDSRCVVCRDGKALDMSIDHKPEDEAETARITQAGGKITSDGRVNGGLNLSRALGDHSYKQNKNQLPEEQMISPMPDIKSITLTSEDKFMVIACDGIWNSMTSQEVVDFILERIESRPKLSKIAEEIFDHCLSPDAHGDGTGCDNMTCIIVKLEDFVNKAEPGEKRPCDSSEKVTTPSSGETKPCDLSEKVATPSTGEKRPCDSSDKEHLEESQPEKRPRLETE